MTTCYFPVFLFVVFPSSAEHFSSFPTFLVSSVLQYATKFKERSSRLNEGLCLTETSERFSHLSVRIFLTLIIDVLETFQFAQ